MIETFLEIYLYLLLALTFMLLNRMWHGAVMSEIALNSVSFNMQLCPVVSNDSWLILVAIGNFEFALVITKKKQRTPRHAYFWKPKR